MKPSDHVFSQDLKFLGDQPELTNKTESSSSSSSSTPGHWAGKSQSDPSQQEENLPFKPGRVRTTQRRTPSFRVTVEDFPVEEDKGLDELLALLIFSKESKEYTEAHQNFLQLKALSDSMKDRIMILLPGLAHSKDLRLPLSAEQLKNFPHLLETGYDSAGYSSCRKLFYEIANSIDKKFNDKLLKQLWHLMDSLKMGNQNLNYHVIRLTAAGILFGYFFTRYIEGNEELKEKTQSLVGRFLSEEKSNILNEVDKVFKNFPQDLIRPIKILHQYLYDATLSLRMMARKIIEGLEIQLELSKMISLSIDGMRDVQGKIDDLVFFVGMSGAGKSTLINYLFGTEYGPKTDPKTGAFSLVAKPQEKVRAQVGYGSKSQTLYPEVITGDIRFDVDSGTEIETIQEPFAFCDCPGFDDNRTGAQQACAALGVPLGLHYAKGNIRAVVVVVDWSSTDGRGGGFRLLSQTLGNMLVDTGKLLEQLKTNKPVPILFAITKPPRPGRDESFDPNIMRNHFLNRVQALLKARAEVYEDLNNKAKRLAEIRVEQENIELCLQELTQFNSNKKIEMESSFLGNTISLFSARTGLILDTGIIEEFIKKQADAWSQQDKYRGRKGCISRLQGSLRKFLKEKDEKGKNEILHNQRIEWEKEKERLNQEFIELTKIYQEQQGEKSILELIQKCNENIFIIRGYKDKHHEDQPDHRDEMLDYITLLREESVTISRENFRFKADDKEFLSVKRWSESFVQEILPICRGFSELTNELEEQYQEILITEQEINKKQEILNINMRGSEIEIKDACQNELERQEARKKEIDDEFLKLESSKKEEEDNIGSINNAKAIEYGSRYAIEKRNAIGWFFNASTSWTYDFPGSYVKATPRNKNRGLLDWVIGHYPDGHGVIPIARVEMSCVVNEKNMLVFGTPLQRDRVNEGDNLAWVSTDSEKLMNLTPLETVKQFYPDNPIQLVKLQSPQLSNTGDFTIELYQPDHGKLRVTYRSFGGKDGYAGVRVFVYPKYLPEYMHKIKNHQQEVEKLNIKIKENRLACEKVEKEIMVLRQQINLLKRGLYNQKEKIGSILNLLDILGWGKEEFIGAFFKNVENHIEWLSETRSFNLLLEIEKFTQKQIGFVKLEKRIFQVMLRGVADDIRELKEKSEEIKLSDDVVQIILEKIPEGFFQKILKVTEETGLTVESIFKIMQHLKKPKEDLNVSLPNKLELQRYQKDKTQYHFEMIQRIYQRSYLKIEALETVITLLGYKDYNATAYMHTSRMLKESGVLTRKYPALSSELRSEIIEEITPSNSMMWGRYVDFQKILEESSYDKMQVKRTEEKMGLASKVLLDMRIQLFNAIQKVKKEETLDLLNEFNKLKANIIPQTTDPKDPKKGQEFALFTLARFDTADWLESIIKSNFLDLNIADQDGDTIFHKAGLHGNISFCDALITQGLLKADVLGRYPWPKNKLGQTLLHRAAMNGQVLFILHIVKKYAAASEMEKFDYEGNTIIHLLVRRGHLEGLKLLMQAHPNLSLCMLNQQKQDPLMIAIAAQNENMALQLLSYSVDLANRDLNDQTALHLAVRNGLLKVVQNIVQKGGDWRLIDKNQKTPIDYAAPNSQIKFLLSVCQNHNAIQPLVSVKARWKNLVFQGGSVKGFAYAGALRALVDEGLCDLSQVQRVAGTSVGSMMALFLGLGYSLDEIDHLLGIKPLAGSKLSRIQFSQFLDGKWGEKLWAAKNQDWKKLLDEQHDDVLEQVQRIDGVMTELARALEGATYGSVQIDGQIVLELRKAYQSLNKDHGFCPGEILHEFFEGQIRQKFSEKAGKKIDQPITFSDLSEYKEFKEMYFLAVDPLNGEQKIFSTRHTPDAVVSDVVRAAMSMPGIFKPYPVRTRESHGLYVVSKVQYIDGGMLWNYPIQIFDSGEYLGKQNSDISKINLETLNLRLVSRNRKRYPEQKRRLSKGKHIGALLEHIQILATELLDKKGMERSKYGNRFRTIYIDALDIGLLDFERAPALLEQGRQGVLSFKSRMSLSNVSKVQIPVELTKILHEYSLGSMQGNVQNSSIQNNENYAELVLAFYRYPDQNLQKYLHQKLGVSLYARDSFGNTAYHIAAAKSEYETLERLLEANPEGAKIFNKQKDTPLSLAKNLKIKALISLYSTISERQDLLETSSSYSISSLSRSNSTLDDSFEDLTTAEDAFEKTSSEFTMKTVGNGDCAFHAALGVWNGKMVECDQVVAKRKQLSDIIKDAGSDSPVWSKIVEGIEALLMGNRGGFQVLRKQRAQYDAANKKLTDEAWGQFEVELRKNPEILEFIANGVKDRKELLELRNQFLYCLNLEQGKLYAWIASNENVNEKFKAYNKALNAGFDLSACILANKKDVLNEYANYIAKPGQWLLPLEFHLIAYAFDLNIKFYTYNTYKLQRSGPEDINPKAKLKVGVCFDGRNHFERVSDEYILSPKHKGKQIEIAKPTILAQSQPILFSQDSKNDRKSDHKHEGVNNRPYGKTLEHESYFKGSAPLPR